MSDASEPLAIRILDREYKVACAPDGVDDLLAAARYLDESMREIRDTGRVVAVERIAVMAALNICSDLLDERKRCDGLEKQIKDRIRSIQDKIDSQLNQQEPLQLNNPI